MRLASLIVLSIWLLVASMISVAHHSTAYFSPEIQEWEGEIAELRWINPHVVIALRSEEPDGQSITREMIAGSIYSLERLGVTAEILSVGTTIRAAGNQSTLRATDFVAKHILLPDGRELVLTLGPPRWPETERVADQSIVQSGEGIFRVWSIPTNRTQGREVNLPFTEEAIAARSIWDPLENFATRCEQPGMPRPMFNPHPFEFIDNGATITLLGEEFDIVRTIHINDATAPATQLETPLGYSVGRWERNTLVVETTRIDWPYFDSIGTPQSDAVEILERFTVNDEENRLDVYIAITDPATFTEPASLSFHWLALGESVAPYECDPL